jgi:hypothetical protein
VNLDLDFDQAIAERALDSNTGKVVVKLGPPRTDEAGMWYCPYKIEGLPDEPNYAMFGGGIDAIQAIIIALANLGAYLNHRKDELELSFYNTDFLGFLSIKQPPLSNWSKEE